MSGGLHPSDAGRAGVPDVEQLYIDPEECIDCDTCVEACPVDAITSEDQVPAEWASYTAKNAAYFQTTRS